MNMLIYPFYGHIQGQPISLEAYALTVRQTINKIIIFIR